MDILVDSAHGGDLYHGGFTAEAAWRLPFRALSIKDCRYR